MKNYIEPLLLNALKWYQIDSLKSDDWLRESLFRLALAHNTAEWRHHITSGLLRFFMRLHQTDWQPTSDFDAILENVGQSALSRSSACPRQCDSSTICFSQEPMIVNSKRNCILPLTKCLTA